MFDIEDAKRRGCLSNERPTRIICWDRAGTHPIVALSRLGDNEEWLACYDVDGTSAYGQLVNLPREVTVFVALADEMGTECYLIERDAERYCRESRAQGRAAGYAPVTIKLTR